MEPGGSSASVDSKPALAGALCSTSPFITDPALTPGNAAHNYPRQHTATLPLGEGSGSGKLTAVGLSRVLEVAAGDVAEGAVAAGEALRVPEQLHVALRPLQDVDGVLVLPVLETTPM